MANSPNSAARKRAVNLTLNEDLVHQAKAMTENLSAVVETLLSAYVAQEQERLLAKSKAVEATIAAWNDFGAEVGSIADDYSAF